MTPIKLYIVEDELIIAHNLKNKLTAMGYDILGIDAKGESAIENIAALRESEKEPDIVIMDVRLSGKIDGIETARILTENYNCGIIFLTALNKSEVFSKSFSLKPYAYLFKPVDIDQIRAAIEVANYQRNLELTNERIISELKNEIEQRKKAEKERNQRLQERIKAEQKVNQLLKQKHNMELDLINRELSTSSIFISQKNKIIGLVKKDINRLLKTEKSINKADIARVLKTIDENIKFDNDWYRIKAHFEKLHPGFFDRLRKKFPQLTPNDHKLAALLRMNLNTKEISHILKITAPSTEISRIRLRKKLELPKGINLTQFICEV
ncbi:MAG TPA: response regulator [Bacteroidales bacterium]|nr:response regulator [Bacteroidales bacterium]HPT09085.1 response regulator [Bacteroidales bacterium]